MHREQCAEKNSRGRRGRGNDQQHVTQRNDCGWSFAGKIAGKKIKYIYSICINRRIVSYRLILVILTQNIN